MKAVNRKIFWAFLAISLLMVTVSVSGGAAKTIDWNDKSIKWLDYDAGLKSGSQNIKPVLLLFYADW